MARRTINLSKLDFKEEMVNGITILVQPINLSKLDFKALNTTKR